MSAQDSDSRFVARDRRECRIDASYQIIIRAMHCRGDRQALALAELHRRGLYLTADQRRQARLLL